MTKDEKIKKLEAAIKKAEEEKDEVYLKYLMKVKQQTINVFEGGTVVLQSGNPPNVPPYA